MGKGADISMSEVLVGPLVSEKSSAALTRGRYTFVINPDVNKIQLKQYFKATFGLSVADVNLQNRNGKKRRVGRFTGRTADRKIAVVSFKSGQTLDVLDKLF